MVILGIVGLLVALSLVAVFTRSAPAEFDAETPEGVVQAYTQAYLAGDYDRARSLVVNSECAGDFYPESNDAISVTLVSTDEFDSSAAVKVTITTTYSNGPFGPSTTSSDDAFHLSKVGDEWLIDTAPWQFEVCSLRR